jgi:hypothetical protein
MSQMPPPVQPMYQPPAPGKPQGLAVASMVLGIVGLLSFCSSYVALPCAVLAIVLGFVANSKIKTGEASGAGMAKAGIILGIITAVLRIIVIILMMAGLAFVDSHKEGWKKSLEDMQKQVEEQQRKQQQGTPPPTTMPIEH